MGFLYVSSTFWIKLNIETTIRQTAGDKRPQCTITSAWSSTRHTLLETKNSLDCSCLMMLKQDGHTDHWQLQNGRKRHIPNSHISSIWVPRMCTAGVLLVLFVTATDPRHCMSTQVLWCLWADRLNTPALVPDCRTDFLDTTHSSGV